MEAVINRFLGFIFFLAYTGSSIGAEIILPKLALSEVPFEVMLNSDQNIESVDLYYDDQVTQLTPDEEGIFSANIQFDSTGQKELSVVSSGSELASKQILSLIHISEPTRPN